ncbi:hypothetical protein ACSTI1_00360, partial [Vibrio parahaemolyticus]
FAPWLRGAVALRSDSLTFSVDDNLGGGAPSGSQSTAPAASGAAGAHQFSPKATLVATPIDAHSASVDLYANWGTGFHSNDVRGAFA